MNSKTPDYQSGNCNIGGAEIRRRKISGAIGGALSFIFCAAALSLHAPQGIRALIFFPLVFTTIGWYQSRRKFCLAFGLMGVFNFGNLGEVSRVQDPAQRSADRAQALKMLVQASAVAAVFTLVFTLVPA